jgi:hypothetical protein
MTLIPPPPKREIEFKSIVLHSPNIDVSQLDEMLNDGWEIYNTQSVISNISGYTQVITILYTLNRIKP